MWFRSRPYPFTPTRCTPLLLLTKGIIFGMYGDPPGGGGSSQVSLSHSVFNLAVILQKPCRKFHIAVKSEYLLAQSGFMCQSLPHNHKSIGLCGVYPNGSTGLTGCTYHLPYIFAQDNPVKELRQDVKHPLGYCRPRRIKKDVICV